MDPFSFLKEECANIERALKETLRHDYGPQRSSDYFEECKLRLTTIRTAIDDDPNMDPDTLATHMNALSALGRRISLIERSHLGEFSWPFAKNIQDIAETLFTETDLDGTLSGPIIHVIAEGAGYQIVNDTLKFVGRRNIVVVAFPRQLKHHVLLHPILGHELGHAAYHFSGPRRYIVAANSKLSASPPLLNHVATLDWMKRADAPPSIGESLRRKPDYEFPKNALANWRAEIICDLFGLILFGPAFAAAHKTLLAPVRTAFDLQNATHPPYAVRRRVIVSAMKALKWDQPITTVADGAILKAEMALLEYAAEDEPGDWESILTQEQIEGVLFELQAIFPPGLAFRRPDRQVLISLIGRLTLARPPILQTLDAAGRPVSETVPTFHCLYAGWSFWLGQKLLREAKSRRTDSWLSFGFSSRLRQKRRRGSMSRDVTASPELPFLEINRLCDYALLQQCAIDRVLVEGHI